jgi:hypothetical protein
MERALLVSAVMSQIGRHHDHGGQGAGVAREALAIRKQQRRMVKHKGFAGLEVSDVWEFANAEPGDVPQEYSAYFLRPWTQLRDEMTSRKVQKVGQLPGDRIKVYRRTSRWVPRLGGLMWGLERSWRGKALSLMFVRPALDHLARLPDRRKRP